jgi:hypothetical protein
VFYGVFLRIYSWVPALHGSPKLVEMVRVKSLSLCLVIHLVFNDAEVGGLIFNLRAANSHLTSNFSEQSQHTLSPGSPLKSLPITNGISA